MIIEIYENKILSKHKKYWTLAFYNNMHGIQGVLGEKGQKVNTMVSPKCETKRNEVRHWLG